MRRREAVSSGVRKEYCREGWLAVRWWAVRLDDEGGGDSRLGKPFIVENWREAERKNLERDRGEDKGRKRERSLVKEGDH